jgi:hypothetical protein
MTKFFIAANVWLMLAVLAFIGRTYERSAPVRYSFFHNGRWLSAESYTLVVATLTAISALFFFLSWLRAKTPARDSASRH